MSTMVGAGITTLSLWHDAMLLVTTRVCASTAERPMSLRPFIPLTWFGLVYCGVNLHKIVGLLLERIPPGSWLPESAR